VPKPTPAVLPKDESNLSFSERYRGTQYSNPDIERFLPPTSQQVRRGRIRGLLTGLVAVALLVGVVAAAWFLFLAPGAQFGLGPSPSPTAAASATPRPTPTPSPSINGLLPDEVEIAACLMLAEDAGQAAELGELQADIAAERTADLPARVDAIAAAIAASRSSLAALESREETAALAAAWAALYGLETEVLDAVRAAAEAGDVEALAGAAERLGEADAARAAVVEAHDALVAAFPEASCVVEAQ
jgi:hypothetical protein